MRIFSYDEIDELGEGLIRQYLGADAERTCCVDIEGFATEYLKLPLLYRSFAEQDTDKIGFIADGVTPLRVYEDGAACLCVFPKGTIVIERYLRRENESGRRRFTISHECAHYLMDKTVLLQRKWRRHLSSACMLTGTAILRLSSDTVMNTERFVHILRERRMAHDYCNLSSYFKRRR